MMKPLTQVAYIPTHAEGDITHPDVEFGFVTSLRKDAAFCRYWKKGIPGQLRTLANSELTPLENLVEFESVPQFAVTETVREFGIPVGQ